MKTRKRHKHKPANFFSRFSIVRSPGSPVGNRPYLSNTRKTGHIQIVPAVENRTSVHHTMRIGTPQPDYRFSGKNGIFHDSKRIAFLSERVSSLFFIFSLPQKCPLGQNLEEANLQTVHRQTINLPSVCRIPVLHPFRPPQ